MGEGRGKRTLKNTESHAARALLPAGGCHFLCILNLSCSLLAPLPPAASLAACAGYPSPSWLLPMQWFSLLEGCAALCGVSHPRGILHITAPAGPLLTGNILPAHQGTATKDPCFPTPGYRLGKKWNKIITIRLVTKSWWEGLAAADGANVLPSPSPTHPKAANRSKVEGRCYFLRSAHQHFIPKICQRSAGTKGPSTSEGLEEALGLPMRLPPSQLLMGF